MSFKNPTGYWHHRGTYIIEVLQSRQFLEDTELARELTKRGLQMQVADGFIKILVKDGMFQRSTSNFNFYNETNQMQFFVIKDEYLNSITREDGSLLWENQPAVPEPVM